MIETKETRNPPLTGKNIMKLEYRYIKVSNEMKTMGTGNRLMDVQKYGKGMIIDFKGKRHTYEGAYPSVMCRWYNGIPSSEQIMEGE